MRHLRLQNSGVMREGDEEDHLRLVLIGKTASGKSSTGNTLFNKSVFQSKISSSPVTKTCTAHTDAVNNRRVTMIDTPDSDSEELKRVFELCPPGAHVILFILSLCTFTEQEMKIVRRFEQMFGSEALRFTVVIFTRAENIDNNRLRSLIMSNNELSDFMNRCGWRVCGMNNKDPANRRQVTELMGEIERLMSENRNSCYTLEMMQDAEKRRQEKEQREKEEKREEEERPQREHQMNIENARRETEIQVRREHEEQERAKILDKQKKDEKNQKRLSIQQMKKYVYVMIICALASGVVLLWRKDSLHRWPLMRVFIITAGSATTGFTTGFFWSLMWKSQFVKVFSSREPPSPFPQLLLNSAGVMLGGVIAGAVMYYFVGKNLRVVPVLSGAAGAIIPILWSS